MPSCPIRMIFEEHKHGTPTGFKVVACPSCYKVFPFDKYLEAFSRLASRPILTYGHDSEFAEHVKNCLTAQRYIPIPRYAKRCLKAEPTNNGKP
jgi:hypothetical protein